MWTARLVAGLCALAVCLPVGAQESRLVVADFEQAAGWTAQAWPDTGAPNSTSSVRLSRDTGTAHGGQASLRVDYAFASDKGTQVHLQTAMSCLGLYRKLSFWVKGDNSGNRLEAWLCDGLSGRWLGQGAVTLDFGEWRRQEFALAGAPGVPCLSDEATVLRLVVVRTDAPGAHTLWLDDVALEEELFSPATVGTVQVASRLGAQAGRCRVGVIAGEGLSPKGPLGLSGEAVAAALTAAGYGTVLLRGEETPAALGQLGALVSLGSTFPEKLVPELVRRVRGGTPLVLLTGNGLGQPCRRSGGSWTTGSCLPECGPLALELDLPTAASGTLPPEGKWRLRFPPGWKLADHSLSSSEVPFVSLQLCAAPGALTFGGFVDDSGQGGDPRLSPLEPKSQRGGEIMKVAAGDWHGPAAPGPLVVLPATAARGRVVYCACGRVGSPLEPAAYPGWAGLLVQLVDLALLPEATLRAEGRPVASLRWEADGFEDPELGWSGRAAGEGQSRIALALSPEAAHGGRGGLRVQYSFPATGAGHIELDREVHCPVHLSSYRFWVKGEPGGGRLECWVRAGDQWVLQGAIELDFSGWREIKRRFTDLQDATKIRAFRLVIAPPGKPGPHTLAVDELAFVPYAEVVPEALPPAPGPWRWEVRREGCKQVVRIKGRPLYGWLDWSPTELNAWDYRLALSAGVNLRFISLDWTWLFGQDPEPDFEGSAVWDALERKLAWMERHGLGALLLLPGQTTPDWFFRKYPQEPMSKASGFPGTADLQSPNYRREMERYLRLALAHTARHPNVIAYGVVVPAEMSSSWYADGGVSYQVFQDLRTERMREAFRDFLQGKYGGDAPLAVAWGESGARCQTAEFPAPPAWSAGYERMFAPLGPVFLGALWEDEYASARWADFLEFCERYSVESADWIAQQIKQAAPDKLTVWVRPDVPWWRMYGETRQTVAFDALWPSATTLSHMPDLVRWREALAAGVAMDTGMGVLGFTDVQDTRKDVEPEVFGRDLTWPAEYLGGLVLGLTHVHPLNYGALREGGRAMPAAVAYPYRPRLGIFVSRAYERRTQAPKTHYLSEFGAHGLAGIMAGPPTGTQRVDTCAVLDEDLSTIYEANVVALPYTPVLSTAAEQELENYVALGGGLLAEAWVGRYRQDLQPRPEGTLAVFGARVLSDQKLLGEQLPVREPGATPAPPEQEPPFDKTRPALVLDLAGPGPARGVQGGRLACSYWALHRQVLQAAAGGRVVATWGDGGEAAAVLGPTGRALYLGTCLFGRYADLVADWKLDEAYRGEKERGAQFIANFVQMVERQQVERAGRELDGAAQATPAAHPPAGALGALLIKAAGGYLAEARQAQADRLYMRCVTQARLARNCLVLAAQPEAHCGQGLAPILGTVEAAAPSVRRAREMLAWRNSRDPALTEALRLAQEELAAAQPDPTRLYTLARVVLDSLAAAGLPSPGPGA